MDQTARAAFIFSQTACATAELLAMQAENAAAAAAGAPLPHTGDAFRAVPDHHAIGWNAAVAYLREG